MTINGRIHYLWRAVDQDGQVLDILLQQRRDADAAKRFFRKILRRQGQMPWSLYSDTLGSYRVAACETLPEAGHETSKYANNRSEVSHQPTRQRERQVRFRSRNQAQRFLALHARVSNLFRSGRHLMWATTHRMLRARAFYVWTQVAYG